MKNEEQKLSKSEYFELRERRLKLVYRILYVVVAIWIAAVISISTQTMTKEVAPMYTFILSASSLLIINVIKYCLMEFRCMKIVGNIDESLIEQTEERYDNIWKSFSVILSFNALYMLFQIWFFSALNKNVLISIFTVCEVYFFICSVTNFDKKEQHRNKAMKFDMINLIVGVIAAYSICAFGCLVMIK